VVTEAKTIKMVDVQSVFVVVGVGIVTGVIVLLIENVVKQSGKICVKKDKDGYTHTGIVQTRNI
jgi:hypothetical protein